MSKEETEKLQEGAKKVLDKMAEIIANAKGDEDKKAFDKPIDVTLNALVTKPTDSVTVKTLQVIKTDTFLDQMFLDQNDKVLDGIPSVSNSILTGLPSSGKSLLIGELALKLAHSGRKTILVTSEDVFRTNSSRYDLESRFKERAKLLGLDWHKVSENLSIIDCVAHAELRYWDTFISTFRVLVEKEKAEILLIDSLTQLEDSRGAVKLRLLEMCRYNQTHNITAIFVSQRSIDEADGLSLSGGLAVGYSCDIIMELDYKKAWSNDSAIKADTGCKQGDIVYFFRILKNRLSKYRANYFAYSITSEGLVRLTEKDKKDQKV